MYSFKKITPTNGFDIGNLNNARQNNYAWSMCELYDYIYVGTGRNIPIIALKSIDPQITIPPTLRPQQLDNAAEIWRYKKDGSLPWTRVYKASPSAGIAGFRYMIQGNPEGGAPCLYAATFGPHVQLLQSYDGINWFLMDTSTLGGTSSRYMEIINNKLYLATVNDAANNEDPFLYRSKDPAFYPWESVIGTTSGVNPVGAVSSMAIFNKRLYVGTSSSTGVHVWRSNNEEPEVDDWTLIVDKGFGDSANRYCLSMGVYGDFLYVSGTKPLPLSWAIPMGFDMIRIDKRDNWQLVVGGLPIQPSTPSIGKRCAPISGYLSGFNNPFNVYAWQIQEYNNQLMVSTFDDSSNMEVVLQTILSNRDAIESEIGVEATEIIIGIYYAIVNLLYKFKYPFGFDFYSSNNGVKFRPIFKNGLGDPNNYGGRMLYVTPENELFLGTANPFLGCEVWKGYYSSTQNDYCNQFDHFDSISLDKLSYEIKSHFELLEKNMPTILKYLEKTHK